MCSNFRNIDPARFNDTSHLRDIVDDLAHLLSAPGVEIDIPIVEQNDSAFGILTNLLEARDKPFDGIVKRIRLAIKYQRVLARKVEALARVVRLEHQHECCPQAP